MRHCLHQGYGRGGYVPQGVEAVARSTGAKTAPPDLVENFVFSHGGDPALESVPVPATPAGFQPAVATYWSEMAALLHTLMELSAVALGLPATHFAPCFARPKCNLRLAYYAPLEPGAADTGVVPGGKNCDLASPATLALASSLSRPAPLGCSLPRRAARTRAARVRGLWAFEFSGSMRYGAHTDYTGFTILRQDPQVSGLEAQTRDGVWHAVPLRPGGLVVNAGDLIQVPTSRVGRVGGPATPEPAATRLRHHVPNCRSASARHGRRGVFSSAGVDQRQVALAAA